MIRQEWKRLLSNRIVLLLFVALLILAALLFSLAGQSEKKDSFSAIESHRTDYQKEISHLEDQLRLPLYTAEEKKDLREEKELLSKILMTPSQEVDQTRFEARQGIWRFMLLLIFLYGLLLIHFLFWEDREEGLLPLLESTASPKKKIFQGKLLLLFLISAGLLIYCLFWQLFLIEANVEIHNWESLGESIIFLKTYSFYFLQAILSFALLFSLFLFFLFLLFQSQRMSLALFFLIVFLGGEYILYRFLPLSSYLDLLKWGNVFSFLSPALFSRQKVGIFSFSFPLFVLCLIEIFLFGLIFFLLAERAYHSKEAWRFQLRRRAYRLSSSSLFLQQLYRLFIVQKAGYLYLALLIFCLYRIFSFSSAQNERDYYRDQMKAEYYGPIDQELLDRLDKEEKDFVKADKEYQDLMDRVFQGENLSEEEGDRMLVLEKQGHDYQIFQDIKTDILSRKEEGLKYYIQDRGFQLFLGIQSPFSWQLLTFILFVIQSLLVSSSVQAQYEGEMQNLYYSTAGGRKKMNAINLCLFSLALFLSLFMVLASQYRRLLPFFPELGKACDISLFLPTDISLDFRFFLLWMLANQFLFHYSLSLLCFWLTARFGQLQALAYLFFLFMTFLVLSSFSPALSPLLLSSYEFVLRPAAYYSHLLLLLAFSLYGSRQIRKNRV